MRCGKLATIRSRCQVLRFYPLSEADTKAVLAQGDGDASLAADLAQGRPGYGQALAETGGASDDASLIRAAAADRAPSLGVLRAEISGPTLKGLERLAHHTYAPATEESRARGAG